MCLIKRHIYWWRSNIPWRANIFPVYSLIFQRNRRRNKILTAIFPFESSDICLGTDAKKKRHSHVVLPHCISTRCFYSLVGTQLWDVMQSSYIDKCVCLSISKLYMNQYMESVLCMYISLSTYKTNTYIFIILNCQHAVVFSHIKQET